MPVFIHVNNCVYDVVPNVEVMTWLIGFLEFIPVHVIITVWFYVVFSAERCDGCGYKCSKQLGACVSRPVV